MTTFISVSLSSECAFRFAEPIVSQRSSTIPTFAWTYSGSSRPPDSERSVAARNRPAAVVGAGEHAELAAGVVGAVVRLRRQHDDEPEVGGRADRELVGEDRDDLRRPQELVLDVDQPLRGAQRPNVALEDRKSPRGKWSYMPSATVRTTCTVRSPAGSGVGGGLERSPVSSCQRSTNWSVDVGDRGPLESGADVVPAEPAPGIVCAGVEAIAAVVGQVDPADERDPAVDHDRLLVMAVERVLPRVGLAPDPRFADEVLDIRPDLRAGGVKGGNRRARPDEHPDVDALGQLRRAALRGRPVSAPRTSSKCGATCQPVMWTNCWALAQRLRDLRQRLRAVDQHLQLAALARRRIARSPQPVVVRLERRVPAEPPEPAAVLGLDRRLDAVADQRVCASEHGADHAHRLPVWRTALRTGGTRGRGHDRALA